VTCFSVFPRNLFLTTENFSNPSKLTDFRTDIPIPNFQDSNREYYVLANPAAQTFGCRRRLRLYGSDNSHAKPTHAVRVNTSSVNITTVATLRSHCVNCNVINHLE
jgi:hypothetical protein